MAETSSNATWIAILLVVAVFAIAMWMRTSNDSSDESERTVDTSTVVAAPASPTTPAPVRKIRGVGSGSLVAVSSRLRDEARMLAKLNAPTLLRKNITVKPNGQTKERITTMSHAELAKMDPHNAALQKYLRRSKLTRSAVTDLGQTLGTIAISHTTVGSQTLQVPVKVNAEGNKFTVEVGSFLFDSKYLGKDGIEVTLTFTVFSTEYSDTIENVSVGTQNQTPYTDEPVDVLLNFDQLVGTIPLAAANDPTVSSTEAALKIRIPNEFIDAATNNYYGPNTALRIEFNVGKAQDAGADDDWVTFTFSSNAALVGDGSGEHAWTRTGEQGSWVSPAANAPFDQVVTLHFSLADNANAAALPMRAYVVDATSNSVAFLIARGTLNVPSGAAAKAGNYPAQLGIWEGVATTAPVTAQIDQGKSTIRPGRAESTISIPVSGNRYSSAIPSNTTMVVELVMRPVANPTVTPLSKAALTDYVRDVYTQDILPVSDANDLFFYAYIHSDENSSVTSNTREDIDGNAVDLLSASADGTSLELDLGLIDKVSPLQYHVRRMHVYELKGFDVSSVPAENSGARWTQLYNATNVPAGEPDFTGNALDTFVHNARLLSWMSRDTLGNLTGYLFDVGSRDATFPAISLTHAVFLRSTYVTPMRAYTMIPHIDAGASPAYSEGDAQTYFRTVFYAHNYQEVRDAGLDVDDTTGLKTSVVVPAFTDSTAFSGVAYRDIYTGNAAAFHKYDMFVQPADAVTSMVETGKDSVSSYSYTVASDADIFAALTITYMFTNEAGDSWVDPSVNSISVAQGHAASLLTKVSNADHLFSSMAVPVPAGAKSKSKASKSAKKEGSVVFRHV